MKKVGEGLSCSSKLEVIGEMVYIKSIDDVIKLFNDAKGKICLVDDAGTTTLGPILSDLAGVVCTTGCTGSHLAIISREYGLPCIMNIKIVADKISLNGKKVKIATEGEDKGIIFLLE